MNHKDLVEQLMAYADCKAQIAESAARNQSAPKYLYEQAQEHIERAMEIADFLDTVTGVLV